MIHLSTVQKMQLEEKISEFLKLRFYCPECELPITPLFRHLNAVTKSTHDLFIDDVFNIVFPLRVVSSRETKQ